jgi:hypothetical protein
MKHSYFKSLQFVTRDDCLYGCLGKLGVVDRQKNFREEILSDSILDCRAA